MSDKTQDVMLQIKSIKTATELEAFEKQYREAILDGPVELRYAFDGRWKELKGAYYFQPVTAAAPPVRSPSGMMHPKMSKYRVIRRARGIIWKRMKEPRKAGQNQFMVDFYHLSAITDDGNQTIGWKLDKNQVAQFCGKVIADQIIMAKKSDEGVIDKLNDDVSCVGYWEVLFHPKSHENDTADVLLSANGLSLQIQRNTPTIVPGPHLNVADDGVWSKYHEEPGVPRKVVAKVQFYGYTPQREASEQEYLERKAEGDRIEAEQKRLKEAS